MVYGQAVGKVQHTHTKKGQHNKQPVSIHVRATVGQRSPYPPILHSFTQPPHDAQHVQQSTIRTDPDCKGVSSPTPIVRHRMLQMMCLNQKGKHAGAANDPASASIARISVVASSSMPEPSNGTNEHAHTRVGISITPCQQNAANTPTTRPHCVE